jgi:YbbR domain-containing protein
MSKRTIDIIISIACAFAIWTYVTVFVDPPKEQTISGVPVEFNNLEALAANGLTVASGPVAVDIAVEGNGSALAALTTGDFSAVADMSNYTLGVHSVEVQVTGPDRVDITGIYPGRVEVEVEELVYANKPIKLNYSEKFPDGMEPGFTSVTPGEIEVSGTKSYVDRVNYVEAEIEFAQLREVNRNFPVDVIPVDKTGEFVYGVSMSQNTVEVNVRLCYVKEVALDIQIEGNPPGALAVTKKDVPNRVSIRGSEEALEGINRVVATPIDISNLRSTTIITPDLGLPKGVELADASKDLAVTIEIGGEEAKSFTVTGDTIEVKGVPDGYSAHVVTGTLNVTIFGSHDQIEDFSPSKLKLSVDLTSIDLTQVQVKLLIDYEKTDAFKRADISPITADVRIVALPETGVSPDNVTEETETETDTETEASGSALSTTGESE